VRPVRPGPIRIRTATAAMFALLLLASGASAHPVPFSYLDVRLQPGAIDMTIVVHVFDAGHDLNVSPAETLLQPDVLRAQTPALEALLTPRFAVAVDGQPHAPHWDRVEALPDRQSIRLHATHALDEYESKPGTIRVWAAMFPYDPQHQTFVNFYDAD